MNVRNLTCEIFCFDVKGDYNLVISGSQYLNFLKSFLLYL